MSLAMYVSPRVFLCTAMFVCDVKMGSEGSCGFALCFLKLKHVLVLFLNQ